MADETKDRLGEKLHERERGEEDQYFARLDREHLAKLRRERRRQTSAGSCPRCAEPLVPRETRGVVVDECPRGCGAWLDKDELARLGPDVDGHTALLTTMLERLGVLGRY